MDNTVVDSLIRAAQEGDATAFNDLLVAHYDRIYACAFRFCGEVATAEDITQQVCIKLADSLEQFRFDSAFTTWLYRVVVNCAIDWQRKHDKHRLNSSDCHLGEGHAEEPSLIGGESHGEAVVTLMQLLTLMDSMGSGFKETVLLVFGEGFTHFEAAQILEVKETTVSWRIHEVRKRVKAMGVLSV
ncbi:RNA polymerase sigma factor [Marinibactrum halimedae]|uniref:DNA-directed RNA polymerase sigma-70 factor n=1 Tax=Marinibactrum halimedae TaxID=1444977 RepID=A0AA37T810_9GAMM|nr:RNA polymerase sigma factor [Marinibactrum halimedae]MCD9457656.1 RNA polymerase sigma factor [Marinibactrum halimedae]GLS24970.1 DNA-directed RNA polymerase sigma-70 factor [Marinibactrum halimedae]